MTEGDREQFSTLLDGVYQLYRARKDLTPFVINLWWEAFKGYDLAAVTAAFSRHALDPDRGQYLPKPADVVRLFEGTTLDSAQQAWTKVHEAVQRIGTYESVCFDDPIINQVIEDMGGWIGYGMVKLDDVPFRAKEFCERYRAYKSRGTLQTWPPYLGGIIERDNSAKGYRETAGPRLIGDPARAKLVLEQGQRVIAGPVRAALFHGKQPTGG